jgi:glutaredoxin
MMVEKVGKRRLILIVAEGCPGCEQAKKAIEGSKANIEILDVTKSEEAARICRDLNIFKVPTLVAIEETEKGVKACTLDEDKTKLKCVESSRPEEKQP